MATAAGVGPARMTAATSTGRTTALFAYAGAYTTKQRNGRGEGISVCRPTGQTVKTPSPSSIAFA
jgi:hypothetical protein